MFEAYVAGFDLADRVQFRSGAFFADPLPRADVVVMGHVPHDWNLAESASASREHMRHFPRVARSSPTRWIRLYRGAVQ